MYNITLIIAGITTITAYLCMIYVSIFDFFFGVSAGLTSVIVIDMISVDKLSNGLDVLYLFQGVTTCLDTPIISKTIYSTFS